MQVELCEERAKTLMSKKPGDHRVKTPFQQLQELLGLPGGLGEKLLGYWLRSMYDLIRNTGVEPGKEFKVSYFAPVAPELVQRHSISGLSRLLLFTPYGIAMDTLRLTLSLSAAL